MSANPLAWSELAAAATSSFGRAKHAPVDCPCVRAAPGACWTIADLAGRLRMKHATVAGWERRGSLPMERGDEVATRLGVLPEDVWPEWAAWMDARVERLQADDEAIADATAIAAASAELHKAVRKRRNDRRSYWRHRARRNAERMAIYRANREQELERQRRYDRSPAGKAKRAQRRGMPADPG